MIHVSGFVPLTDLSLLVYVSLMYTQKHAYCEIDGWIQESSITYHRNKKNHQQAMQQYNQLKKEKKTGRLVKRGSTQGTNPEPLWSFEPCEDEIGEGAEEGRKDASLSSISCGTTTSATPSMAADGGPKPSREGDGYFVTKVLKTLEQKQGYWNRICGWLTRDGRPFSILQGQGWLGLRDWLNPALGTPHYNTIRGTLIAMTEKRRAQIGSLLRQTSEGKASRSFNFPEGLKMPYLPEKGKQVATVSVPPQFNAMSMDGWKRNNGPDHYYAITTFTLTHEFELMPKLVHFRQFPHRSLGVNLARVIDTCHAEYGIGADTFEAFVLDGGADIQKAARVCKNKPQRIDKCSIHTLQRVIIQACDKMKCMEGRATIYPLKRLLKTANHLVRLCKNGSK